MAQKFNKSKRPRFNNKIKFNNDQRKPYQKRSPRRDPNDSAPWKVDTSYEMMAWFAAQNVIRPRAGEDTESLLKRFKRKVEQAKILSDVKKREYYKSPGELRREKKLKALKNLKKRQAKDKARERRYN